ncbi:hypothetical protein D3C71_1535340 [compost metagenome]
MDLRRGGAEPGHEQALQLACAQAHPRGERADRRILQEAVVDQRQRALQGFIAQCVLGFRRQLRAAAQARAETGGCRRGRRGVVIDVARFGRRRRAHGPAVDAGAAHRGEKHAVKARIAGQPGAFAGGVVQGQGGVHGRQSMPGAGPRLAVFGQQCVAATVWFRAGCRGAGPAH